VKKSNKILTLDKVEGKYPASDGSRKFKEFTQEPVERFGEIEARHLDLNKVFRFRKFTKLSFSCCWERESLIVFFDVILE